jgi:hypothetical protein
MESDRGKRYAVRPRRVNELIGEGKAPVDRGPMNQKAA